MQDESFSSVGVITEAQIQALLQDFDDDPATFDARMDVWTAICDMEKRRGPLGFSDIERATFERIATELKSSDPTTLGSRMSQMLNHFEHPTFLVASTGKIIVQNEAALASYQLNVADNLSGLPFEFEAGEGLGDAIARSLSRMAYVWAAVVSKDAVFKASQRTRTSATT